MNSDGLRVLIVDDHSLLNDVLASVLTSEFNFIVHTASSLDQAILKIQQENNFDVVLVDLNGPGLNGLKGVNQIKALNTGKTAIFSGFASPLLVERAVELGFSGVIPKNVETPTLARALHFIASGEFYAPVDFVMNRGNIAVGGAKLKDRELKVLTLLCNGMQNKEIASTLNVEESTIKMDVKSICEKFGVKNRTQAVVAAIRRGLET